MTCIFPSGKCYNSSDLSAMEGLVVGHRPSGSAIGPAQKISSYIIQCQAMRSRAAELKIRADTNHRKISEP
ncbi:hypothetical protein Mapa_011386 [Marchantia paleacea]|nr:hypothetical protein Mapa_011386 [Marchantia paleacea]